MKIAYNISPQQTIKHHLITLTMSLAWHTDVLAVLNKNYVHQLKLCIHELQSDAKSLFHLTLNLFQVFATVRHCVIESRYYIKAEHRSRNGNVARKQHKSKQNTSHRDTSKMINKDRVFVPQAKPPQQVMPVTVEQ
jgi:hypothetical protein